MADEKDEMKEGTSANSTSKGNGRNGETFHIEILDPDEPMEQAPDAPAERLIPPVETGEEIPELEKRLMDLKKEKEEIYDRLLRKHADFENYRKRVEKDKREYQVYALSEFMLELVAILDNFERALSHPDEQSGPEYRKGVELIYRQLRDLMEKKGLRAIDTAGQPFDPNYHEAILREQRGDLPENSILEELQKGYFFREKLLRPALVKVSFQPEYSEESQPMTDDQQGADSTDEDE